MCDDATKHIIGFVVSWLCLDRSDYVVSCVIVFEGGRL